MKRFVALVLTLSSSAWAGNFAECILDKMPGVANGSAHAAVIQTCSSDYPGRYNDVERGAGRGFFGFRDGASCVIERGSSTPYQAAAAVISFACHCLYDKPATTGERCSGLKPFTGKLDGE